LRFWRCVLSSICLASRDALVLEKSTAVLSLRSTKPSKPDRAGPWAPVPYDVERKCVRKDGKERIFTHIHVKQYFPIELTVYASGNAHLTFKSSITGKPIERASMAELEQLLAREYPELVIETALEQIEETLDPFQVY